MMETKLNDEIDVQYDNTEMSDKELRLQCIDFASSFYQNTGMHLSDSKIIELANKIYKWVNQEKDA
jgi:hypothetical protein